jgi:hypothetical protein
MGVLFNAYFDGLAQSDLRGGIIDMISNYHKVQLTSNSASLKGEMTATK